MSSFVCKPLNIVISSLILWSMFTNSSLAQLRKGPEYLTKETTFVFIAFQPFPRTSMTLFSLSFISLLLLIFFFFFFGEGFTCLWRIQSAYCKLHQAEVCFNCVRFFNFLHIFSEYILVEFTFVILSYPSLYWITCGYLLCLASLADIYWFSSSICLNFMDYNFYNIMCSDYCLYLYCYIHNVSANASFNILLAFLVGSLHRTSNRNLYLIHTGSLFWFH